MPGSPFTAEKHLCHLVEVLKDASKARTDAFWQSFQGECARIAASDAPNLVMSTECLDGTILGYPEHLRILRTLYLALSRHFRRVRLVMVYRTPRVAHVHSIYTHDNLLQHYQSGRPKLFSTWLTSEFARGGHPWFKYDTLAAAYERAGFSDVTVMGNLGGRSLIQAFVCELLQVTRACHMTSFGPARVNEQGEEFTLRAQLRAFWSTLLTGIGCAPPRAERSIAPAKSAATTSKPLTEEELSSLLLHAPRDCSALSFLEDALLASERDF